MPEPTPSPPAQALGEREDTAALSEPAPHMLCRSGAAATQALAVPSAQGNPFLPPALSGDAGDRVGSEQVAHPIRPPSISQRTRSQFDSGDLPIPVSLCSYLARASVSARDVLTSHALTCIPALPAVPLLSGEEVRGATGGDVHEPARPRLSIPIAKRASWRRTDGNTLCSG